MIVSYKPGNLVYPCIYEKETFPRYALGKLLDREKNAEELKVSSRPGFASESRCYRNDRVRNACNVVPQRYSRQHEYYFIDISWKIGNIAGNIADKTEFLG